jgi:hypothetical protein
MSIAHPRGESTLPVHPASHLIAVTCPTCGTPFVCVFPTPFDPGRSGILDYLSIVEEDLRQLKHALEEVVL